MLQILSELCGGVGLFLIGMTLLTDSLKEIAGQTLKELLTRFTATPFKAMLSGLGMTLLVHSSTATIVAAIGFVGAGVLSFTQAMSVVIGANIGTTSTGWIVAFLGMKFSISMLALPMIALGALLKLIAKGQMALLGLVIAGFGLIFFGIDVLQKAMAGFAAHSDLSFFGYDSLWSQLLLVLIGIIMAMLLQSSSASITATMAALVSGAIDLPQALYMVIGQNIGAVGITVISVIGASINAKRTVAVNVIFNLVSAIAAFFLLAPFFLWLIKHSAFFSSIDQVIMLALFHTTFSVLGACMFMPSLKFLEQKIIQWLPSNNPAILDSLDDASLQVPAIAVQAAEKAVYFSIFEIFKILQMVFQTGTLPRQQQLNTLNEIIQHIEQYLEKIAIPEHPALKQKFLSLLRVMVYVRVLHNDLERLDNAILLRTQPAIFQLALDYCNILESYFSHIEQLADRSVIENLRADLNQLKKWTSSHRAETRKKVMEYTEVNQLSASKGVELLAAQRWMDRLIAHSYRFSNVMYERLLEES